MLGQDCPSHKCAGATPFLASRQYPRQQELLGQECPSHECASTTAGMPSHPCSVGVHADRVCLDKIVQATVARTFLSVRCRTIGVPADETRLDKNVQATSAQARLQECRRTTVASASTPIGCAWTRLSKPRVRKRDGRNAVAPTLQAERGVSIPPKKRVRYHSRADRVAVFLAAG